MIIQPLFSDTPECIEFMRLFAKKLYYYKKSKFSSAYLLILLLVGNRIRARKVEKGGGRGGEPNYYRDN